MRLFCLSLTALLAAPASAGTFEYALTLDGKSGSAKIELAATGDIRVDARIRHAKIPQPLSTSLIVLSGNPDVGYYLTHQTRTFGEVAIRPAPTAPATDRYTVGAVTDVKLDGQATKHVTLTDTKSGDVLELWLDATLGDFAQVERLFHTFQPHAGPLRATLKKNALAGLPRKARIQKRHGGLVEAVLTAHDKKAPDESRFGPPRGYIRVELPEDALTNPEALTSMGGLKKLFEGFTKRR